jgi:ribosomal protein S21
MALTVEFREWRRRRYHVKPGEQRRADKKQGIRRTRKRLLKRFETSGY